MSETLNLYQRISAVMQDVKRLQKDKQVGSGSYAYKAMSEEKVITTLRTAMIEHGLVIFPVEQAHTLVDYTRHGRNGEATTVSISTVDVKYKLVNIDNPAEFEILASSGTGVDPQDKGVGKAMTYSMKYALMRAFLIPTGEDPDDVHNEELARQQQQRAALVQPKLSEAQRETIEQARDIIKEARSKVELREAWDQFPSWAQAVLKAESKAAAARIDADTLQATNA